jgi:hypothetical protein
LYFIPDIWHTANTYTIRMCGNIVHGHTCDEYSVLALKLGVTVNHWNLCMAWNKHISSDIRNYTLHSYQQAFSVYETDRCTYNRHGRGERFILCLYVDDIQFFGTNFDVIKEVKSFLCQTIDMKDLGEVDVILNIKLIKGENWITLM